MQTLLLVRQDLKEVGEQRQAGGSDGGAMGWLKQGPAQFGQGLWGEQGGGEGQGYRKGGF